MNSPRTEVEEPTRPAVRSSERSTFRRNVSWIFIGNTAYAACQWGLLVLLAKLGDPEMVGRYSLGLALTAPAFMLANLQLRGALASDALLEYRVGEYFGLRTATSGAALIIVCGISAWLYQPPVAATVIVVAIAKAIESLSDIGFGLLQRNEDLDRVAKSLILKGALSVVAFAGALRFSGSLLASLAALATSWGLVLTLYDLPAVRASIRRHGLAGGASSIRPIFSKTRMQSLAKLTLPLGLVMMLGSFIVNIPRYFLEHAIGERALGVFSAIAYLIVAGNTVISAVGQSAIARLSNDYAAGNKPAFNRKVRRLLVVSIAIGLVGILVAVVGGSRMLTIIYGPEYARYDDAFVLLMCAGAASYSASVTGFALTAARRFVSQLPQLGLVGVIALGSSYALVPRHGVVGAAWALTISFLAQFIFGLLLLMRAVRRETGRPRMSYE